MLAMKFSRVGSFLTVIGIAVVMVGVVYASSLISSGGSKPTTAPTSSLDVPTLDPSRFDDAGVNDAMDVTTISDSELPASKAGRQTAIENALTRMGFKAGTAVRVYRGHAQRYPEEPTRDVWIIVAKGGISPGGGPPQIELPTFDVTLSGAIVDADSGEVLVWFQL